MSASVIRNDGKTQLRRFENAPPNLRAQYFNEAREAILEIVAVNTNDVSPRLQRQVILQESIGAFSVPLIPLTPMPFRNSAELTPRR